MSEPLFDSIRNGLDQGHREVLRRIDAAEAAYAKLKSFALRFNEYRMASDARIEELEREIEQIRKLAIQLTKHEMEEM